MSLARRIQFGFTSYYCVHAKGMKDLEILTRASAYMIPSKWNKSKVHILTAGHAVAPWKFPNYVATQEWLKEINENHVHYCIDVRNQEGQFTHQFDLLPKAYLHPTRDFAVLQLEDEDAVLKITNELNFQKLKFAEEKFLPGSWPHKLHFHGHEVCVTDPEGSLNDSKSLPRVITGDVFFRTDEQIFARTSEVLKDGMCGGPVTFIREGKFIKEHVVSGMVEGIVPADPSYGLLQETAVFVETGEIQNFIENIEQEKILPTIVGGEVHRLMTQDLGRYKKQVDEDWEKINRN